MAVRPQNGTAPTEKPVKIETKSIELPKLANGKDEKPEEIKKMKRNEKKEKGKKADVVSEEQKKEKNEKREKKERSKRRITLKQQTLPLLPPKRRLRRTGLW